MSYNQKPHRYPGTLPFSTKQKELFKGRKKELDEIIRLIKFQQIAILYGKSGYGKSSLINAAILPELINKHNLDPISIRFYTFQETEQEHNILLSKNYNSILPQGPVLSLEIIKDNSLWYAAKARQFSKNNQPFLLVFDQFEELFTYPERQIKEFVSQLAELLRSGIPQRVEQILNLNQLEENELDIIYETIPVKVIFVIRNEFLYLLEKFSSLLPNILRHSYELLALSREDARLAIVEPASQSGDFASPKFQYNNNALNNILDFLGDDDARIEAIQLQTLCQAFERKIVTEGDQITEDETKETNLKLILNNYYQTQLTDNRILEYKEIAQQIIEEELVVETDAGKGVRVALHELSLKAKFSTLMGENGNIKLDALLDSLVELYLLRKETDNRRGDTYELAHDRLVTPVLSAKHQRFADKLILEQELKEAETKRLLEVQLLALRKARIINILVSFLAILSIVSTIWALGQTRLAKNKTEEIERELTARKEAEIQLLLQRYDKIDAHEKEVRMKVLEEALKIDSTNLKIKTILKTLKK